MAHGAVAAPRALCRPALREREACPVHARLPAPALHAERSTCAARRRIGSRAANATRAAPLAVLRAARCHAYGRHAVRCRHTDMARTAVEAEAPRTAAAVRTILRPLPARSIRHAASASAVERVATRTDAVAARAISGAHLAGGVWPAVSVAAVRVRMSTLTVRVAVTAAPCAHAAPARSAVRTGPAALGAKRKACVAGARLADGPPGPARSIVRSYETLPRLATPEAIGGSAARRRLALTAIASLTRKTELTRYSRRAARADGHRILTHTIGAAAPRAVCRAASAARPPVAPTVTDARAP